MRALTALCAMVVLCGCGAEAEEALEDEEAPVEVASVGLALTAAGTITNIEPNADYGSIDSIDDVFYARTVPKKKGQPYGWWSRLDVRYLNDSAATRNITGLRLDTNQTATEDRALTTPVSVTAGSMARIEVPAPSLTRQSSSYPTLLEVELLPLGVSRTVPFLRSDAPTNSGGFRFPAKASDIASGQYWLADVHGFNSSQAYAYDLKVVRWNGSSWTWLESGGNEAVNEDHLAFGVPVYAVADGWIKRCARSELDNEIGSGGNNITMEVAGGEYISYWHMKRFSVSAEHCPFEGVGPGDDPEPLNIFVRAGTKIGEVGNSGNSSRPHLHLQRNDTLPGGPESLRSLPMPFQDIDARSVAGGNSTDPTTFTRVPYELPSALHVDSDADAYLISPNPCGFPQYNENGTEVTHHGMTSACFDSISHAVVDAGFMPVWVDGYDVAGKTYFNAVWRQDDGVGWSARHAMTSAQYQDTVEDMLDDGLQISQVDSYLENGAVRYAAIFRAGLPLRAAYHAQTVAQHQERMDTWPGLGRHPVHVSVVSVNGARQYTAVWEQSPLPSWVLDSDIPSASLNTVISTQSAAGRKVHSLQGYVHGGALYFAGVFGSSGPTTVASGQVSGATFQPTYEIHRNAGRDTRLVTGFESGGAAKFVGVWTN